jgi:surface protein
MPGLYEDLLDLTSTVINAYLAQEKKSPFELYECYRALYRFNDAYQILLEHSLPKPLDEECLLIGSAETHLERWILLTNEEFQKTTAAARELADVLTPIWFVLVAEKSVLLTDYYLNFFKTLYEGGVVDEGGRGIDAVSYSIENNQMTMKKIRFEIGTFEERLDLVKRSQQTYSKFIDLEAIFRHEIDLNTCIKEVLGTPEIPEIKRGSLKASLTKEEIPKNASGYYIVDNKSIREVVYGLIPGVNVHNIDTSNVTDMSKLFSLNENFNEDINHWDVFNVENMCDMFRGAKCFNQPLDRWNVARVTDMYGMFKGAHSFNQPLESWDVSNVVSMGYMFWEAIAFDQPIEKWNVSNVTTIGGMFMWTIQFNQPLNGWDISKVCNMGETFHGAEKFNQPLDKWDTSNVEDMLCVFSFTQAFNQPLESWNVSKVIDMSGMFSNAKSFNQSLDNWDVSNVEDMACLFCGAVAFDQPLSSWNLLKCTI